MNETNSTTVSDDAAVAAAARAKATQALLQYLSDRFDVLQVFLLSGYGIMFLLCIALITYLRRNRNVALRGDADAARKLILPAFEPLLWILCATTGTYAAFFCVALATNFYTTDITKLATEVFYSGRQFVFVIVVVYMFQKSVSIPALQRTVLISFALSTYTLPIVYYMSKHGHPDDFYWVLTTSRALLLILYTYVMIYPPGRASKRTVREFCLFAYVYYALLFTYNELFHSQNTDMGFTLTYVNLLWGSLCPLVIWRVLKADTEYWRGMGQRACALQSLFRQKHHINEHISSQGLHVLIEMHRKYIIDFAYLELKQRIGVGASAVVFNGILHSTTPVAIKVYTPSDFTEETVASFSHEAALCGALHHPNIVRFYGMCVFPPTICLVSELCQGSLADVTIANARQEQPSERQQLLIDIGYMIDAARAVAYIHSFSPAFLHRDIKPENFLVDDEHNVKLTDFGESRSIPRTQIETNASSLRTEKPRKSANGVAVAKVQRVESTGFLELSSIVVVPPSPPSLAPLSPKEHAKPLKMTVKGTVDYMAPEVINGRAGLASYGEAADVYSLAITMWDILNPGKSKYPVTGSNHFAVFELVLDGHRPVLDPRLHSSLREVIEGAWQSDPQMRPSAQNVISVLETIQEEVAAVLALRVYDELNDGRRQDEHHQLLAHNDDPVDDSNAALFSGDAIVKHLERHGIVNHSVNSGEAVRMGNTLMDAGLLHHARHAQPFEKADDALYFFDDDAIQFCHPIAFLEPLKGDELEAAPAKATDATGTASQRTAKVSNVSSSSQDTASKFNPSRSRSDRTSSQSMHHFAENGLCLCRKLGQRLELAARTKAPRKHRHHPFHRKFRRKQLAREKHENLLTAKLLRRDNDGLEDELSGFETVVELESTEELA